MNTHLTNTLIIEGTNKFYIVNLLQNNVSRVRLNFIVHRREKLPTTQTDLEVWYFLAQHW